MVRIETTHAELMDIYGKVFADEALSGHEQGIVLEAIRQLGVSFELNYDRDEFFFSKQKKHDIIAKGWK